MKTQQHALLEAHGSIATLFVQSTFYADYEQDVIPCIGRDDLRPTEIRVVRALETSVAMAKALANETPQAYALALACAQQARHMEQLLRHAKSKRVPLRALLDALAQVAGTKPLQTWNNVRAEAYDFRHYRRESTFLYHVQQGGKDSLILCRNNHNEMPVAVFPGEPTVFVWAQPIAHMAVPKATVVARVKSAVTVECSAFVLGRECNDHDDGTWYALPRIESGSGRHSIILRNARTKDECHLVLPKNSVAILRVPRRNGVVLYT